MPISVKAIIIGLSDYHDPEIENLPAATADAILFAQSLMNWGIEEKNIDLILNQKATMENVLTSFENLKAFEEPFKLVFYYCGHGYRSPPPRPKSHLMLHRGELSLDQLLREVSKLDAIENYLFIDACQLRINSLINPELEREIQEKENSHKSLFCLLSSGIDKSYEDVAGEYGYFTNSLLKGLSKIRFGENSPTVLLENICNELRERGLSLPEMYNIATHRIDFFPSLSKGLPRMPFIAKIQDKILEQPGKILCLLGEEGIGKTTISKLLSSEKCRIYYFDKLTSLDHLPPYSLVIIDSIRTRDTYVLNNLIEMLLSQRLKFILTARKSFKKLLFPPFQAKIHEIEVPPFDFEEVDTLIDQRDLDLRSKELIFLASRGNPQKIKNILFDSPEDFFLDSEREEIQAAISAIMACGLYLNEELFCKVYNLKPQTLTFLEDLGLVFNTKNAWIPHECLFDIAESEDLPVNSHKALQYWALQIEELPSDPQAAKSLILTMKCFGYQEKIDPLLYKAFETLRENALENRFFFHDGFEVFDAQSTFSKTSLFLSEILLEIGDIELAERLLRIPPKDKHLAFKAKMHRTQCLWRMGKFHECKRILTSIIERLHPNAEWFECLLNRGNASFFLGEWQEALHDFSTINRRAEDPRFLGWAKCMLGSILGLRGIDAEQGKKHLEEGIHLLIQAEENSGVWVGWNNLGEMLWKIGEYRQGAYHLQKALDVAFNSSMKLETLRNLLQTQLRAKGPHSKEVTELLKEVEELGFDQVEFYEKIQLFNTLATIHLFRGEYRDTFYYLRLVIPLTSSNREYHFWTLYNLALLFSAFDQKKKSQFYQSKIEHLAKKENYPLAVVILKEDLKRQKELLEKYATG